jgi:DNA-binding SARP family transcriptional activator/tetratricopeptide (TPR) repeat protein
VEFRILGPLEVVENGTTIEVPPGKQRTLLAALLLSPNEIVSVERLIDAIWGAAPPGSAANALQVYVSNLRKLLEPGRPRGAESELLRTAPPGYQLRLGANALDLASFEHLAAEGRRALGEGDFELASAKLRDGLALWRGSALADVPLESAYASEPARLDDMRLAAVEDRLEAEIALGNCAEHIPTIETLIVENPLRERLRGQLMLALYRTGRQAEALAAYAATREVLVEELGIEPSPALQRLERGILVQDPELELIAAPRPAAVVEPLPEETEAPAPVEAPEVRRRVTIAVWTLARGTEAVEPEVQRSLGGRALEIVRRAQERHGASTETIDGETIRAVFGAAQSHEDDALRAARAAMEALREVELFGRSLGAQAAAVAVRAGIETGLVVADAGATDATRMAGAPLSAAAGLVHEAGAGEIVVGPETEGLLRRTARFAETGRGSWRLLEVPPDAVAIQRQSLTPLVGRRRELDELRQAFDRAVAESSCVLATVLGAPGLGKSRLARELRTVLPGSARVLEGRCLPYGEGIGYAPVRELVTQAVGADLDAGLRAALAEEEDGAQIAERVAAALEGREGAGAPEELALAFRRLFEALGRRQPLVLVLDDLHWAEPALLTLIEQLAQRLSGTAILLLCIARPELADTVAWADGSDGRLAIGLEPLDADESAALVDRLAEGGEFGGQTRAKIAATAQGNPLFIEQLLAAVREEGSDSPSLPRTIEALLGARLDLLEPGPRQVLERAAVIGRRFSRRAVVGLGDEGGESAADLALATLQRRQLIAPATALGGDFEFHFAHDLIREVCYSTIPLGARAALHEGAARVLESEPGEGIEADAAVGHHLELAHRWLAAVAPDEERLPELAARAASLLAAAGRHAYAAGDIPAATGYLGRAVALRADDPERAELLVPLAGALREVGEIERARAVATEALEVARAAEDRKRELQAEVLLIRLDIATSVQLEAPQLLARADQAIAALEALGDDPGLADGWTVVAWIRWTRCRAEETEDAIQRALLHARRAGDERAIALNLNLFLGCGLFGPTPVPEAIDRCERLLAESPGPRLEAAAYRALGGLHALQGRFDEARAYLEQDRRLIEELGMVIAASAAAETWGIVELLAGRPAEAEKRLKAGLALLEGTGEKSQFSTLHAVLAETACLQGRFDEALEHADRGEEAASPDDLTTHVQLREARAHALAATGHPVEALEVAREAASLAGTTDFLTLRGESLITLAEVLSAAGQADEARAAAAEALELLERKGNTVTAARAQAVANEVAAKTPV